MHLKISFSGSVFQPKESGKSLKRLHFISNVTTALQFLQNRGVCSCFINYIFYCVQQCFIKHLIVSVLRRRYYGYVSMLSCGFTGSIVMYYVDVYYLDLLKKYG